MSFQHQPGFNRQASDAQQFTLTRDVAIWPVATDIAAQANVRFGRHSVSF